MKSILFTFFLAIIGQFLSAQVNYTYDGQSYSFTPAYQAKLNLSPNNVSIDLLEEELPDLDKIEDNQDIHHPYRLLLHLENMRSNFPVSPEDTVILRTTQLEVNLAEQSQATAYVNSNSERVATAKEKLEAKKKAQEAKMKALMKRIQEGDMSAAEELEKLSQELVVEAQGEINGMGELNAPVSERFYDFVISQPVENNTRWISLIPTQGTLRVNVLNRNEAVISFSGMAIKQSEDPHEAKPLELTIRTTFNEVQTD